MLMAALQVDFSVIKEITEENAVLRMAALTFLIVCLQMLVGVFSQEVVDMEAPIAPTLQPGLAYER